MGNFKEKLIRKTIALSGMNPEPFIEKGIINLKELRNWIVKGEYYQRAKSGKTYTEIKHELSEEYGISISSIEKLIYRSHEKRCA
jgi:hypothetical protein